MLRPIQDSQPWKDGGSKNSTLPWSLSGQPLHYNVGEPSDLNE
jgi:hypothetical protein